MFQRHLKVRLLLVGLILTGVMMLVPINSFVFRIGLLLGLGLAFGGIVAICWAKYETLCYGILSLPVAAGLMTVLPGTSIDAKRLRSTYVAALRSCENRRYIWGGEGRLGLDRSGLPRKAWRNALLVEYARTLNGSLLRDALEHWWFDASARALSQGYREYTVPIGQRGTIRTMCYAALEPGDLAITDSGVHVLAFLGGQDWVQADPGPGRLIVLNGRTGQNAWFDEPVTIFRWTYLNRCDTGPEVQGAKL